MYKCFAFRCQHRPIRLTSLEWATVVCISPSWKTTHTSYLWTLWRCVFVLAHWLDISLRLSICLTELLDRKRCEADWILTRRRRFSARGTDFEVIGMERRFVGSGMTFVVGILVAKCSEWWHTSHEASVTPRFCPGVSSNASPGFSLANGWCHCGWCLSSHCCPAGLSRQSEPHCVPQTAQLMSQLEDAARASFIKSQMTGHLFLSLYLIIYCVVFNCCSIETHTASDYTCDILEFGFHDNLFLKN